MLAARTAVSGGSGSGEERCRHRKQVKHRPGAILVRSMMAMMQKWQSVRAFAWLRPALLRMFLGNVFLFGRKFLGNAQGKKKCFFFFRRRFHFVTGAPRRNEICAKTNTASSALKFFTHRSFHFGQHSSGHQPLILSLAPVIEKLDRKLDLYICSSNFRLAMSSTEEFDAEQAKLQKSVYDEHNYAFTSKMIKKLNRQMLLNQLSAKIPVPKKVVEQSLAGKSC